MTDHCSYGTINLLRTLSAPFTHWTEPELGFVVPFEDFLNDASGQNVLVKAKSAQSDGAAASKLLWTLRDASGLRQF